VRGAVTAGRDGRAIARPGDGLLHPVALLALVVLVLNDHVLKAVAPGFVTGKLSDVAGLIVAPLAIQGARELEQWVAGRWQGPSSRALLVAIVAVAIAFAAGQVWDPAADAYAWALAAAQWPFRALGAAATGAPLPTLHPVTATADAEDLLTLPALALTWWAGRRRNARV
jgi:hypothetical protein